MVGGPVGASLAQVCCLIVPLWEREMSAKGEREELIEHTTHSLSEWEVSDPATITTILTGVPFHPSPHLSPSLLS